MPTDGLWFQFVSDFSRAPKGTSHAISTLRAHTRGREMTAIVEPLATDGEISAKSARRRAWARLSQDAAALDRLDALASQFARVDASAAIAS
jgi:ribosomal protein L17